MFKKREKNQNQLKRTVEDRYQVEEDDDKAKQTIDSKQDDDDVRPTKRQKGKDQCCDHGHQHQHQQATKKKIVSTKDHVHYRSNYIASEVSDISYTHSTKDINKSNQRDGLKQLEIDTPYENDAFELAKKNIEISQGLAEGKLNPNVYRGEHGYQNYFNQTESDLKLKQFTGTLGPLRAPTFIRSTTRVDYNPELCKDYYETGKCGFGDSCIFIHDRGDYKPGWQLDQEFEQEQKKKQLKLMGVDVNDEEENYEIESVKSQGDLDEDGLPIVCRICEQIFRGPVVTTCMHYFCERCALDHYSKNSDCFVCGKATNGIFNEAPKLQKKAAMMLKKQQEEEEQDQSEDQENEDGFEIGSQDGNEEKTTVTNKQKIVKQDSSSDDDSGVLSKQDKEVFQQYKQKFKEIDKKKYEPQNGWFIP